MDRDERRRFARDLLVPGPLVPGPLVPVPLVPNPKKQRLSLKFECVVCLTDYLQECKILRCLHKFCVSCIDKLAEYHNNTCPLCRHPINEFNHPVREILYVESLTGTSIQEIDPSSDILYDFLPPTDEHVPRFT